MAAANPQLFLGGLFGRSVALSAQMWLNAFMDIVKDPMKEDRAKISAWCRPGLGGGFGTPAGAPAAYYGSSPLRGKIRVDPYTYCVYGNTLYQLAANGALAPLGNLQSSAGRVYFVKASPPAGQQVACCDALGNLYIYQINGASISALLNAGGFMTLVPGQGGFLGAVHLTYSDNVAVAVVPGSQPNTKQQFQQSNTQDFTAWNALAFSFADALPDPLLATKGWNGVVYTLGSEHMEIWQNLGLSPFQFGRAPTNIQPIGIAAVASLAEFGDLGVALLAQTVGGNGQAVPMLLQAGGFPPSNQNPLHDDDFIATINAKTPGGGLVYGTLKDAVGDSFMWDGHRFYLLAFPTAGVCWLWDERSGRWSQLTSDTGVIAGGALAGIPTGVQGRFRGQDCLLFNEQLLFFDWQDGHIYLARGTGQQDTDNGCPILWQIVSSTLNQGGKTIAIPRMQLDFEVGVSNLAGAGSAAQVQLEVSRDMGRTFGVPLFASLGAFGQFVWRAIFRRLGAAKNWTFRVTCTDPVKRVLVGEMFDTEVYAA